MGRFFEQIHDETEVNKNEVEEINLSFYAVQMAAKSVATKREKGATGGQALMLNWADKPISITALLK